MPNPVFPLTSSEIVVIRIVGHDFSKIATIQPFLIQLHVLLLWTYLRHTKKKITFENSIQLIPSKCCYDRIQHNPKGNSPVQSNACLFCLIICLYSLLYASIHLYSLSNKGSLGNGTLGGFSTTGPENQLAWQSVIAWILNGISFVIKTKNPTDVLVDQQSENVIPQFCKKKLTFGLWMLV